MVQSRVLSAIANGNEEVLGQVYVKYKGDFLRFAQKQFGLDTETGNDIYADLVLEFRSNIVQGKLKTINSSLKNYLFGIGKNMVLQHLKRRNEETTGLEKEIADETEEISIDEQSEILLGLIENQMTSKCYKILKLFYYDYRSLSQIKSWLNYSSIESVSTQKNKCMKHLKSLVKLVDVQYKLFNQ